MGSLRAEAQSLSILQTLTLEKPPGLHRRSSLAVKSNTKSINLRCFLGKGHLRPLKLAIKCLNQFEIEQGATREM